MTTLLAIETSCDETAAAVLRDGHHLLANVVSSQAELHRRYGGVFPEMASRQHMMVITPVIRDALTQAGVDWAELDALAVTHGPGLAGSLLVGVNAAKGLALACNRPLVPVNHLEAHVYANWLPPTAEEAERYLPPSFPLVCLVVSGGHTDLVLMRQHHDYQRLGRTVDDAAGEAFDKVARLLGLGYPGGPAIQRAAESGDPTAYDLPMAETAGAYDFSFSGLKTAVLRLVQEWQRSQGREAPERGQRLAEAGLTADEDAAPVADIAASFQAALVRALVQRTVAAAEAHDAVQVLLAGGVAANRLLREEMARLSPVPVRYPPLRFCTDNAAMIAVAGHYRYLGGCRAGLDLDVHPNLPLV